ncbi:hypothetical protein AAC03nite_15620 [Alicyclobacillus acidoterrestris]|uniref:hypothetical protein n=2 Tax=Alicyclobacillus suci TaxID=2816080 RepID=UPI001193CBD7|nr:hypothetical protein [Alicyclobacillus suci]GEO25777.1 hypothetical protein AAC03nite_15620 [Alicyclobacillus acidoterrestris]
MMKKSSKSKSNYKFIVFIAALTLPISAVFDTSTIFLNSTTWYIGAIIVIGIVFIGALFDMIGMAAAAARETPFHAMASKRVYGARRAISIVRNAEKVSSICSDVIGDIAGVLSGAGALAVSVQLLQSIHASGWKDEAVKIAITAVITSLTVGGKAIGKTVAIHSPTPIILMAARIWETVSFVDRRVQRRKK